MQKHLFLLFFLASIIFAYSCKADVGQPQINSAATADADEQLNEPSEAYLDSRSLRDELVEKIIADNYRISEEKLDEYLALHVLDPEEWGGAEYPTVYKKNTETLLKYSLPTYKKDDSCDILELDEENLEEIVIQAFDFLIDGVSGFAITSNDDRLSAILYCNTNDAINRQQLKAESILKINNKMNDIKREWACITTGDVYSVLERAYGVKRDFLTRNIFKDIKNFFSNTRWSSVIEGENRVKGLLNYFSEDDVLNALYKRADAGSGDWDSRYADRFRSAIVELADSYFSSDNGNSVYNFSGMFERNAKMAFDEADSIKDSIVKDYHPYRGVVVREDNDNDIDASTFLFPIDVMLINEYPVISYSYIDAHGDKKTIRNVWQYIKTLDRDSPMPSVAKRILQHIKYLILDHDGSWANLFHNVYKTFDNIDGNKKRVAQYIKDRYGANGKNKYMYTDLNYGNVSQGSHINYVYENTLSRFGYKFVYEVEKGGINTARQAEVIVINITSLCD